MEPTNSSYGQNTSVGAFSSNDVVWNGPNIPCIDLCKGDKITEVMFKVASKLCELVEEFDLSDLDLQCIYSACEACPDPDKSLINVFRLLIDAFCELKERVDELGGDSGSDSLLDVNLKCLAIVSGSGEVLNGDSNKEIVQSIIDEVCLHRNQIGLLNERYDDLQNQIDNLPTPTDFELPDVGSQCLFTGTRALDDAFDALDQAFCGHRTAVGSISDINLAISKQPDNVSLGTGITNDPLFINNPSNLAQSEGNLWVAVKNLIGRVTSIEDNCCKIDCTSVELGFSVSLTADRSAATVVFSSGTGTSIPNGFTDCGSVMTVTDLSGNFVRSFITLSNDVEEEIDLSGLDVFSDYVFNLDSCLSNGGMTCKKCLTKTIKYADTCSFCEITATGTTGVVVVVYEEPTVTIGT